MISTTSHSRKNSATAREAPRFRSMLARGLMRRCPWCGNRSAFFDGWSKKQSRCSGCGLDWRREDVGFELGAAAVAAILTIGPLIVALGVTLAITWPAIPTTLLLLVFVPAAILFPIALYPTSYTTWQAVDILMRPVNNTDCPPADA